MFIHVLAVNIRNRKHVKQQNWKKGLDSMQDIVHEYNLDIDDVENAIKLKGNI